MRKDGERRWRVCNGAEGSGAMPKDSGRCYRVWNGGGESGAVFYGYNTVTEPGMLPEGLRHRFRAFKRKEKPWCLTWAVDSGHLSEPGAVATGFLLH